MGTPKNTVSLDIYRRHNNFNYVPTTWEVHWSDTSITGPWAAQGMSGPLVAGHANVNNDGR
jgi:hypothetical protein